MLIVMIAVNFKHLVSVPTACVILRFFNSHKIIMQDFSFIW